MPSALSQPPSTENKNLMVAAGHEVNAYIYISEAMAKNKGINNFDTVEVESINGQTRKFIAFITDSLSDNQLYAPIHYIETNALTPSVYDTYSKEPSYKSTPVNIKKAI